MACPAETQSASIMEEISETVPETQTPPETIRETLPPEEHFILSFTGDCTLGCAPFHDAVEKAFLKTVGDDYGYPFRNVLSYFEEDDMTLINLEGTFTDTGYPVKKKFNFRGPERYTRILTENSVDLVTLANNHTMDFGNTGYNNTVRVLEEAGVPYVERDNSRIVTLDRGLTVGVYGVVYYKIDMEEMQSAIRELKQQADFVVLAAHWGAEGSYYPTQDQIDLAHGAIDAGADFVWGHHPHVLQNMEKYKDGIICYSLGNFSFGGHIYPRDFDTALIQLDVVKDTQGEVEIRDVIAIPCSISSTPEWNNYQPTPMKKGSEEYRRVVSKLDDTFAGPNLVIKK